MIKNNDHTITIIIPVWNIESGRGGDRLTNMLQSISDCKIPEGWTVRVIVADGSEPDQSTVTSGRMAQIEWVPIHATKMSTHQEVMNLPQLYNLAMDLLDGGWVLISGGCDFIYSPDLLESYVHTIDLMNSISGNRLMILKRVRMMNKISQDDFLRKLIDWHCDEFWNGEHEIDVESFPFNPYGKEANGVQFFHHSWFRECGGYDERMARFCGMDNDMVNRAERAGMVVEWMEGGHILHQWHENEKQGRKERAQAQKNWEIRDNDKSIVRNGGKYVR